MKKVLITYASLTGNTQFIANEIHDELVKNEELEIAINPISNFKNGVGLDKFDYIIIGASTWGDGDVPPGTEDIFTSINNSNTNLSKVYISYFGLGDKKYKEFNTAVQYLKEIFSIKLGANKIGNILLLDGYPNSENISLAVDWASESIAKLNK
ncbi:flavodoxin family protein [Candidatus Dojkabacteria bacterium]|uniref:Flavodoxin family protein n=1 Tax=Candidatus Dojkabacteria bacterium TaxID=2099670 RepID=A0A955LAV3_9BACT|nr:flavodoxin family protein [Candidatus Dojkabacteria bacterium]